MSTGMWGAILFLIAAGFSLAVIWHMSKPEPEDPPGGSTYIIEGKLVTITHVDQLGWNYICDDPRAMHGLSTGYLTRGSAVRAARAELKRLQERDNTS